MQVNSSSTADSKAEKQGEVPLLKADALQQDAVQSMQAMEKPERKLKETRTFNPRKMRPKRSANTPCGPVLKGHYCTPFTTSSVLLWGKQTPLYGKQAFRCIPNNF